MSCQGSCQRNRLDGHPLEDETQIGGAQPALQPLSHRGGGEGARQDALAGLRRRLEAVQGVAHMATIGLIRVWPVKQDRHQELCRTAVGGQKGQRGLGQRAFERRDQPERGEHPQLIERDQRRDRILFAQGQPQLGPDSRP